MVCQSVPYYSFHEIRSQKDPVSVDDQLLNQSLVTGVSLSLRTDICLIY